MDLEQLHNDIRQGLPLDPIAANHMATPDFPCWKINPNGLLLLDKCIYVPDLNDLHLWILQNKHDHILSGHLGQNKTIELI